MLEWKGESLKRRLQGAEPRRAGRPADLLKSIKPDSVFSDVMTQTKPSRREGSQKGGKALAPLNKLLNQRSKLTCSTVPSEATSQVPTPSLSVPKARGARRGVEESLTEEIEAFAQWVEGHQRFIDGQNQVVLELLANRAAACTSFGARVN